jgi:hypothetical protein
VKETVRNSSKNVKSKYFVTIALQTALHRNSINAIEKRKKCPLGCRINRHYFCGLYSDVTSNTDHTVSNYCMIINKNIKIYERKRPRLVRCTQECFWTILASPRNPITIVGLSVEIQMEVARLQFMNVTV